MPMEEQLLLKEMHMKNSITITPSKQNNKSGKYIFEVEDKQKKKLKNIALTF